MTKFPVFFSADNWIKINEFCQATGMKLLFDLNVLLRTNDSNSSWDPRNAELLLDYSFSQGYHIDWELGNGKYCYSFILFRLIEESMQYFFNVDLVFLNLVFWLHNLQKRFSLTML